MWRWPLKFQFCLLFPCYLFSLGKHMVSNETAKRMTHWIVRSLRSQTNVFVWYAWQKADSIKHGQKDGWIDGWAEGWMDGWTDESLHNSSLGLILLNYISPFSYFQLPSGQLTPNSYWTLFPFLFSPTPNELLNFSHIYRSSQSLPLLPFKTKSPLNKITAIQIISWISHCSLLPSPIYPLFCFRINLYGANLGQKLSSTPQCLFLSIQGLWHYIFMFYF